MKAIGLAGQASRPLQWWPQTAHFAADFVSNRYMREGIEIPPSEAFSLSRTSTKMARNRAGHWLDFAENQPARTNRGLLVEAAETYQPVNAQLSGAVPGMLGSGGALPDGWTHTGDFSLQIVAIETLFGLPTLILDILIDNSAGASTIGRSIKLCSLPAAQGEFWTMGLFAQVLETFAGDTATSATNIAQIQERNAGGGFLNNSGGVLNNLDLGALDQRRTRTKQMTDPACAIGEVFCTWNNVLAGQTVHRRIALQMFTLTKGQALSSPMLTTKSGPVTRTADTAILHLPEGTFDLSVLYDDGSTSTVPGVSGDHELAANAAKAYKMIVAVPV